MIDKARLNILQKKGQAGLTGKMNALIGGVIVIFLVVALAPEIFDQLDVLSQSTTTPAWVPTVLFVVAGAGIVFLVYRSFM